MPFLDVAANGDVISLDQYDLPDVPTMVRRRSNKVIAAQNCPGARTGNPCAWTTIDTRDVGGKTFIEQVCMAGGCGVSNGRGIDRLNRLVRPELVDVIDEVVPVPGAIAGLLAREVDA